MNVQIQELTAERVDDFLYFFDHVAFTDNPKWASCYCYYYQSGCSNEEWEQRTAEQNRAATEQLIRAGKMHGYLAYANDEPVGWVHAKEAEAGTMALKCFLIAPTKRGQGIASQLLAHACGCLQRDGYQAVEGHPVKAGTNAQNYHGPLEMYLKQGFEVVEEDGAYVKVRKTLLA